MSFTKEQADEIKKQLFGEIEKLPDQNREQIRTYVEGLNENELEEFLEKNKIRISEKSGEIKQGEEKPVFQLIIDGKIPSHKIAENPKAIAILEINPLSKGHVIILPKKKLTTEKMPKAAFILAKEIAKKIKSSLKPLDIKIETFSFQDYAAINVVPLYANKELKKEKAKEEDLAKLQKILEIQEEKEEPKEKKEEPKKLHEVKSRSPRFS